MSDSYTVQVQADSGDVIMEAPAGVHRWHIPRPSLIASEPGSSSTQRGSTSSQGSSSTTSTQSGASGSLLLTAANLAQLAASSAHTRGRSRPWDTTSLASSEHFTVVNGLERRSGKPLPACCCRHRQLPVLVIAMSAIFLAALLIAVLFLEMRWRDVRMFT